MLFNELGISFPPLNKLFFSFIGSACRRPYYTNVSENVIYMKIINYLGARVRGIVSAKLRCLLRGGLISCSETWEAYLQVVLMSKSLATRIED